MSLNAPLFYCIPAETAQVAKAAFPKGNRYLLLRDTFGPLFHNPDFRHLFSYTGQPGEDPTRLALITILQFAERLFDDQAADAARSRIDWKYLLALPLTNASFDGSVLSEFRKRLVDGEAEHLLFDTFLTQFREQGLLRARGRQRSESTHVLVAHADTNPSARSAPASCPAPKHHLPVVGRWLHRDRHRHHSRRL